MMRNAYNDFHLILHHVTPITRAQSQGVRSQPHIHRRQGSADHVSHFATGVRRRMARIGENCDAHWHMAQIDDVAARASLAEVGRPDARKVLGFFRDLLDAFLGFGRLNDDNYF